MEKKESSHKKAERIVVATETSKEDECDPQSTFGPNGAITDPVLLAAIQQTKPLGPIDILKLAEFFSKFPINILLTESLRVSALTEILMYPQLKKDVETAFQLDINATDDSWEDSVLEEWKTWPETQDQNNEDSGNQSTRFIPINLTPIAKRAATSPSHNVGLVVQSIVVNAEKTLYFVVGLSPAPETLPLAGLKAHRARKPHTTHA